MQHDSLIYTRESIENTDDVSLDKDGLLLCALLLGGDYGKGIAGAGKKISQALAAIGLGRSLARILRSFNGPSLDYHLAQWRTSLGRELRTMQQSKLADTIPDTFPDLRIAYLYLNPLTSSSVRFTGQAPEYARWKPEEIDIFQVSRLCSIHFMWHGENLLKKLTANLWPAVTFKLISSVRAMVDGMMHTKMLPSITFFIIQVASYWRRRPARLHYSKVPLRTRTQRRTVEHFPIRPNWTYAE